jgi:alpha-1,3/alpha-1,6-mannosyltransferase
VDPDSLGQADVILSNSLFTSKVYSKAFPSLAKRQPKVVYPCIDVNLYRATEGKKQNGEGIELIRSWVIGLSCRAQLIILSNQPTLLSLNRFEEKKNVALAIKAFSTLQTSQLIPAEQFTKLRLVVGGKSLCREAS